MELPVSGEASFSGWAGVGGHASFKGQISFRLEPNGNAINFQIHDSSKSTARVKTRFSRTRLLRRRFLPVGLLKNLGNSITSAYHSMFMKKKPSSKESLSARKSVDPMDDHVSEAVKDCIEYIHSCSVLKG